MYINQNIKNLTFSKGIGISLLANLQHLKLFQHLGNFKYVVLSVYCKVYESFERF